MTQEEIDFIYFETNQLVNVDFLTGKIDVKSQTKREGSYKYFNDVGHVNQDGYIRIRCNGRFRMKHRLLFWLYHGYLPIEVDHDNDIRNDNSISNLKPSDRKQNTVAKAERSYKQLTKEAVKLLCADIVDNQLNITQLAKKYGRSRVQIKGIMSKKYWSKISDQYF